MKLKTWQKNLLSVVVIMAGGFILFNLAFILAAVINQAFRIAAGLLGVNQSEAMNPMLWKYVYAIVILVLSWFVLKSKLNTLVKATYLTMPLMVLLILAGILLYQQPQWVPMSVGAVIVLAVILYLFKRKLSWQYYIATVYTAALALYIVLAGIEI